MHVFQPSPGLQPALLTKIETLSSKKVSACSQRIVQSSSFPTSHLEKKSVKYVKSKNFNFLAWI
jgi:hypothetical protein